MKIAIRQTRKGDWLIFEARPHTLGIGLEKVGQSTGAYTTGQQFDRRPTRPEAESAALEIAQEP